MRGRKAAEQPLVYLLGAMTISADENSKRSESTCRFTDVDHCLTETHHCNPTISDLLRSVIAKPPTLSSLVKLKLEL
jgi:hypothetical protein